VHFGVILPNYAKDSSPDGIRRVAEDAEELGFDSVWTTEHIIVGPGGVDPYGRATTRSSAASPVTERREQRPIGRLERRPLRLPAQDREFVAQDEDLELLRPLRAGDEHSQLEDANSNVEERQSTGPPRG
jgi:hypothetical protein